MAVWGGGVGWRCGVAVSGSAGFAFLLVYTLVSPLGLEGYGGREGTPRRLGTRKGAADDARTRRQKRFDEFVSLAE